MSTNDLREKIITILTDWEGDIVIGTRDIALGRRSHFKGKNAGHVSDRIISLLPKMPELRWTDEDDLFVGSLFVGYLVGSARGWYGVTVTSSHWSENTFVSSHYTSKTEARAAVEAAVRKALGWK